MEDTGKLRERAPTVNLTTRLRFGATENKPIDMWQTCSDFVLKLVAEDESLNELKRAACLRLWGEVSVMTGKVNYCSALLAFEI